VGISSAEALELFYRSIKSPLDDPGRRFRNSGTLQRQRNSSSAALPMPNQAGALRTVSSVRNRHIISTAAPSYPLKTAKQIITEAGEAAKDGAEFFGIVTRAASAEREKEWAEIFKAIKRSA